MSLQGSSLAGSSTTRDRVENDYYATPFESVESLLKVEKFSGDFIEPCVGGGHIANVIKSYYPKSNIIGIDIIDRGYENTIINSYFDYTFSGNYNIITNPPYKLAQEFIEHSLKQLSNGKKIAMFLKIQFLEGVRRKDFFKKNPPKTIYVFSKRQNPMRDGEPTDENGKPWSSTMCFAWFVWEKGYKSNPIIKWI